MQRRKKGHRTSRCLRRRRWLCLAARRSLRAAASMMVRTRRRACPRACSSSCLLIAPLQASRQAHRRWLWRSSAVRRPEALQRCMLETRLASWTHSFWAHWWTDRRGAIEGLLQRAAYPPSAHCTPHCSFVVCSRDLEIQAALEQIERLSMSRPVLLEPPPAVDPGLLPLTETQLKAVAKAMAPGADAEVLASDSFKGASRHSRCPCLDPSAECVTDTSDAMQALESWTSPERTWHACVTACGSTTRCELDSRHALLRAHPWLSCSLWPFAGDQLSSGAAASPAASQGWQPAACALPQHLLLQQTVQGPARVQLQGSLQVCAVPPSAALQF